MILESKNLVCGYGSKIANDPVIRGIDFHIEEGSKVAILGANGSGKTTLVRAIGGVLPYEGSLTLDGKEIRDQARSYCPRLCSKEQRSTNSSLLSESL